MAPNGHVARPLSLAAGGLGVVVGAGVLAAGVGLLPHLAEGLTSVSVIAVLLLVVGTVLLVALGRLGWRGHGWRGRLALVPATLVLVALGLLTVGQAVAATVVPRGAVGATPGDVGLAFVDARLRTSDGVDLAGWYVPSGNGAAVVLLHGAGSTRSDTLDHAKALSGLGYGVLLVDARGHGQSAGRAMDFGWWGDLDVRAAVDALSTRPDVTDGRIAVVGLSMGGEEAIGALAADPRIRAAVAEGATHRIAADRAWLADVHGARGWVQLQLDRLTYALADALTTAPQPAPLRDAVARAAPRPVLLVAAAERPDEQDAARFLAAVSPSTVQVWTAPGGHTGALAATPGEWSRRVGAFLADALAP